MIEIVYASHPNGKENGVLLMGYLNNEFVGTAVVSICGKIVELESIHTNPNSRGRGVASALLQELRGWGKKNGGDSLTGELLVREDTISVEEVVDWYGRRNISVRKGRLYGKL